MSKNKRLHFKDLDALRFLAFIPIFLFSIFYLTRTETEGVHYELTKILELIKLNSLDFFFFLSAFLLTSQALREYKYFDSFSLQKFWMRRLLRLSPLFLIALLFVFLVHPWILKILKLNSLQVPGVFDYFIHPPFRFSIISKEQFIYSSTAWTIYMFAQFYLVMGFILRYFHKKILLVSVVFLIAGITTRIVHYLADLPFEFDMLAFLSPAGIGLILGWLVRNESPYIAIIKQLRKPILIAIYTLGVLWLTIGYILASGNFFLTAIVPLTTCVFFSFVVIEQTFGKNSLFKLRKNKVITHLGKISFGMIVYQSILNTLILIGFDSLDFEINSQGTKILFAAISFILTWVSADLSYNLLEKPLLRLRREFKKI